MKGIEKKGKSMGKELIYMKMEGNILVNIKKMKKGREK